jgi:hypothetical protein
LTYAQGAKTSTIHVVFQGFYERARPGYAAGIATEKFDLVRSGGNNIQQTFNSSTALANKTFITGQTLGGRWRVAGPHRLVGTEELPQSTRTMIIDVHGKTCTAPWKPKLKQAFNSIVLGANARQSRVVSATCEIDCDGPARLTL